MQRHYTPHRQYGDQKIPAAERAKRLEALKKFRPRDKVLIGESIPAEFVRADTINGNAIVLNGRKEQTVNPLNLTKSTKAT